MTSLGVDTPARTGRAPSLVVLMLLVGISPLATDMYLAALPAIQDSLHTSATAAQLTLTGFLIGLACGQFVVGPLSDAIGRRPFLIGGSAAFLVMSLLCAIAPDAPLLVTARVVQGFVSAWGIVCGKAVITDYYPGGRADRRFAIVTSAGLIGPIVAPPIGGLILSVGTWREIFLLLTVVGVVMVVGAVTRVPETLPPERREPSGFSPYLSRIKALGGDRVFRGHVVTSCLAMAGFFTYIGGSPFVLEHVYGISETLYTIVFATGALTMVASSLVFAALVERVGSSPLRLVGLGFTTAASLALVVTGVTGTDSLATTWATLAVLTAGMGLVLPGSIALAQSAGARFAGTASALQGGLQFLTGALVTPLVGMIGYDSVRPMAFAIGCFMLASLASAFVVSRRRDVPAYAAPEPDQVDPPVITGART